MKKKRNADEHEIVRGWLSAYAKGGWELMKGERDRLERHLLECDACDKELRRMLVQVDVIRDEKP